MLIRDYWDIDSKVKKLPLWTELLIAPLLAVYFWFIIWCVFIYLG